MRVDLLIGTNIRNLIIDLSEFLGLGNTYGSVGVFSFKLVS